MNSFGLSPVKALNWAGLFDILSMVVINYRQGTALFHSLTKSTVISFIDKAKVKNDPKLFKKLNEDIWEFRTLYSKKQHRLFAFWDKSDNQVTTVIATHGIIKKTQKTPKKEIDKAIQMMSEYFNSKK